MKRMTMRLTTYHVDHDNNDDEEGSAVHDDNEHDHVGDHSDDGNDADDGEDDDDADADGDDDADDDDA
eukprot:7429153-Karenia_brevis.AAC.1